MHSTPMLLRGFVLLIVAAWLLDPGQLASGQDDAAIVVEQNVAVPMRDGTVLRANVFRPSHGGPFPVLVMRTPYGKPTMVDEKLVKAGFIVITQDARGRYASEGQYESFVREDTHDGVDGFDTIEWAAKLPNSTGKVGMFGTSYNAFLQWKAAAQRPPSLVAIAAFSIPATYTDLEGPGTIRPGRRLKWWQGTMSPDMRRKQGGPPPYTGAEAAKVWDAGEGDRLWHTLPWLDLPDEIFASEAPFVKAWLRQPWRDPWKLAGDAKLTSVPNLNVCGWYDHCNGSIDLHTAIFANGGSEMARKHSKLIIGPWSHNSLGQRKQGEIDFGSEAQTNPTDLHLEWFGHWLRGDTKSDVAQWPAVKVFVMGAGRWRSFDQWPPKPSRQQELFLASDGKANTPQGDGRLVDQSMAMGQDAYDYDPHDPVPTLWTKALYTVPADQRPLAERRDILVYQTPPLAEPIETIGYPEVTLFAASSCPDTDFFARLIDVSLDGASIDVASGMIRARYRDGLEKPDMLRPGEPAELRIRLRPTAHRFLAGHRVRLDITSSDFPNYDRNHNTAADQNADTTLMIARQTIYQGKVRPSRIALPIVEP